MKLPRAPRFWWQSPGPAAYALAPFAFLYGEVAGRRMAQPGSLESVPVICIGNLVVGGAGKTPTALEMANVCRRDLSMKPGFLTRGYGGNAVGPVLVAPSVHGVAEVGDEALLLAREAPTVVAADRPSGVRLLASLGVDLVIMDDGFQNPSLAKDLSLVLVDAAQGIGNGLVIPAGPLRAPLRAQFRRADALLIVGEGPGGDSVRFAARAGLPVLRAHIEPLRRRGLKRRPYLAFTGIGRPKKFYAMLAASGASVPVTLDFPDHHVFTEAECEQILATAKEKDIVPITTEKDHVRLIRGGRAAARLAAAVETFPIRIEFEEPRRLIALIKDALAAHASPYRQRIPISDDEATALA